MFKGCSSLKKVDFGKNIFNNIKRMSYMFEGCSSIESIDLSNFKNLETCDIYAMFQECPFLREIEMYRLNFDRIKWGECSFDGCLSLKSIRISQINEFCFNKSNFKRYLPESVKIFVDGIEDDKH